MEHVVTDVHQGHTTNSVKALKETALTNLVAWPWPPFINYHSLVGRGVAPFTLAGCLNRVQKTWKLVIKTFVCVVSICSFDLIYDAVGNKEIADNAAALLRPFAGATYVSIVVPLLLNVDANGIVFGLTKSACQLSTSVVKVFLWLLKPITAAASAAVCCYTQ